MTNIITGTAGDDNLSGTSGADTFELYQGGNDTASGLGGADTFKFADTFTADDSVDGGAGSDTLWLNGDYSAGVTFADATMTSVETIFFSPGFNYNLTTADANVAAGETLTINATKLGAGNGVTFDGAAETDGHFKFEGGAGNDNFTGGAAGDTYDLRLGGEDTVHGGAGNDLILVGGQLDAGDKIDGGFTLGSANNVVRFDGDYSAGLTLGADTLQNIQTLQFDAGHDYNITVDNANFLSGPTVWVNGSGLGAGDSLTFDASASDANFHFFGGAGNDNISGGTAADVFDLSKGGEDTAHGGDLSDRFIMGGTLDANDAIDGGAGNDIVEMTGMGSNDAITFGATTLTSVETLVLDPGHLYDLTTNDGNVAAGATLLVRGESLGLGDDLTFDGSAETDGHFIIRGGQGDDDLTGGQQSDVFNLTLGGADSADGQGGNDTFTMGAAWNSDEDINGNTGNDTMTLNGDYGDSSSPFTIFANMFQSIETLTLFGGSDYYLATFGQPVATGQSLTVDMTGVQATDIVQLDFSSDTGATFTLEAGAHFTAADSFIGAGGGDTLVLDGDYTGGNALVLGSGTVGALANLVMAAGYSYDITTNDGNVASAQTLEVNGSGLGAGDSLTFDGSAETNGHFIVDGGAGDDTLTGGQDGDTFNLEAGGEDTATGGAGNDTFNMGNALNAATSLDGGAGNDTVILDGSAYLNINFSANNFTSIETLKFEGNHGYNVTTDDGNVAAGQTLTVDFSDPSVGYFDFAGSPETDGNFLFYAGGNFGAVSQISGGTGNDTLELNGDYAYGISFNSHDVVSVETIVMDDGHSYNVSTDGTLAPLGQTITIDASALTGANALTFDATDESDGFLAITAGAGDDSVKYGGNFSASDTFDGGAGNDTLELNGDYSAGLTFGAATITNVETLQLDDGFSYQLTTNDATVASGATLTVDASALTGTNALTFDGSAETNGFFAITGGAGDDTVKLGSHFSVSDAIDGGAGNDTVTLTNLNGSYHFANTTIQNVEDLVVTARDGDAIAITTTDANVAAGATMTVDFSNSGPGIGTGVTFNGSAETDGHFAFIEPHEVGSGVFSVTGGALSDTLSFTRGDGSSFNSFNGLGGDDTVTVTANTSTLTFNGGTGNDTLAFTGGGSANQFYNLTSVENVTFDDHNWNVAAQLNLSAPASLNVDATALSGGHTLAFDGSDFNNANDSFVFEFGANFIAGDSLTGNDNNDTLALNGDYSGGITFGASTISSIETITVADGHTYTFTENDGNVASGATLTVDASALTGSNQLFFNGEAETDGHFAFIGGAADDDLEGGAQSDTFDLSRSDGAFVSGNGGNDSFTVTSAAKFADDSIDGGAGSDTLILNGGFSTQTAITASNVTSIETLQLLGAFNSYDLTLGGGIAGAATLTIDGSAASSIVVDASGAPATAYAFIGSAGNDTLTGGAQNDSFNLTGGGNDTVSGGAGNDTFSFGNTFTAADTVDGGANSDAISLSGDYSAGLTFSATNMTSVETLALNPGHSYNLTTNDANVASGTTLNVSAGSLGAGDTLTFDGSAETDGHFSITGGAGNDTVTGGALADTFDLTKGGTDTVHGGGDNDTITLGSSFSAASAIDGGTGSDTVNLVNVSGNFTFTATTITNVEDLAITVTDQDSASFTTNDANVAAGATMIVDFSSSGPEFGINTLTFDGSAETDGHFAFIEPISVNIMTLTGGALSDTLSFTHGDGGDNTFNGLGGDDTATTTANASRLNFDGGTGNDTLAFTGGGTENGDYFFTSVENVTFDDNNWTVNQRFEGAAASLNVDVTALSGGHTLTFNGVDTVDGPGIATDSFVFEFAGNFISGDSLTGGDSNDTLSLDGDYSAGYTFGASQLTSIEDITLADGHSYKLTTNDANVASGQTLTIDASGVAGFNSLHFDGSAETDGHFVIYSAGGGDFLEGGAQSDTFYLTNAGSSGSVDVVQGNGGADIIYASTNPSDGAFFSYEAASDSTSTGYDTIHNMNFDVGYDAFVIQGESVTGIDDAVTTGTLRTASFDSDLATAVGAGQLGAHHAVLFTPDSGDAALIGHTFLIVDMNGTAGYQASQDLVIDVTGYTGTLTTADFA